MEKQVRISQSVAVLIDGNNIEISIHKDAGVDNVMCNFDDLVPKLIGDRSLNRLVYFREGKSISPKLADRLHKNFYGVVKACRKNADIRLTIEAIQLANKVDTIIIMSGDSDYIELVQQLKSQGLRVEIAGVASSTSKSLIEEADFFHEITKEDWFSFKN
jgi:predicted nuclease of predicted toxin-antitoxin system